MLEAGKSLGHRSPAQGRRKAVPSAVLEERSHVRWTHCCLCRVLVLVTAFHRPDEPLLPSEADVPLSL